MSYAPAGSTTQSAGLLHLATVYYERKSLDRLEAMFHFASVCHPHPLPQNSGKTLQMNRYALPGFNTTPAAEGAIGAPVNQSSSTVSATVEQYSDFFSSSALLEETDINPTVDRMVDDASYRAAGTVDTLIRAEIDSNSSAQVNTIGTYFTAADAKQNVALLKGQNVRPFDNVNGPNGGVQGGDYIGVIHPYIVFDVISDNTAGGFIDASKYQSGVQVLNGEMGKVGGIRFMESTNVATTGSAPNVKYSTYIHGFGGIGIVDLAGRGPERISDPRNQRFKLNIVKGGPSPSDPVGEIATYVSYRFVFAAKTLDTSVLRFKIVLCDASAI